MVLFRNTDGEKVGGCLVDRMIDQDRAVRHLTRLETRWINLTRCCKVSPMDDQVCRKAFLYDVMSKAKKEEGRTVLSRPLSIAREVQNASLCVRKM